MPLDISPLAILKLPFIAFVLLVAGCQNLEQVFDKPDLQIVNLNLAEREGLVQFIDLTIEIKNSNPYALNLVNTRYSFQLSRLDVISGATDKPLKVPANGSDTVTFRLGFDMLAALELVRALAASSSDSLDYQLKLELDTGLPFVGVVPIVRQWQVSADDFTGR